MDDVAYKTLVESACAGRTRIGVDRVFARQLYTDVSVSAIERDTGETRYLEKLVVWAAFIGAPLAILASAVTAIIAFG